MKVAVLGLGMEGKNAVNALLEYGIDVYASDLNKNIVIPEFKHGNLDIDLGLHDINKIKSADAVVISPGLWDTKIAKNIITDVKLLSDMLTAHKKIFTVGVTGTNGKTTTCYMLKDILQKSDLKVLLGGNAGGGFDGYTKLILEASRNNYDIMIVEVCDMTLDYVSNIFNFDMVIVTNIGHDHMNYHLSLKNFSKTVCNFLIGKKIAILNENDHILMDCADCADETFFFGTDKRKMKLFGEFNQENASAASKAAKILGMSPELINKVLKNFNGVDGRTKTIDFEKSRIFIGKTDNPDATAAVLKESKMDVIIIGTPRKDEKYRYNILKEVSKAKPSIVVLFPGLDNTTNVAEKILRDEGYDRDIYILNKASEVVEIAYKFTKKYNNIFIGGNGQKNIVYIQKKLNELSKSNSNY
jgi:UDP-N-acetylmuramoylalanine--D-glutamate ligase